MSKQTEIEGGKTDKNNIMLIKQPVVVVIGHVDHGKSSLLDYIRKTNIVDKEAGGITQKISAYEVEFINKESEKESKNKKENKNNSQARKITFIDTPGHEAFQNMRERSLEIADIAILVVSAEDGVKEQTIQAYNTAIEKNIPVIVAINKIDKPGSDIEKTKNSLIENGIYLEGMGGDITYTSISAKVGTGVNELLENILLQADINEIKYNKSIQATGKILESFLDKKRGISATLIIKDGVMPANGAVLAGISLSPIRIVEDFNGKSIKNAIAGQAIMVTGFDEIPTIGSIFITNKNKKALEELQKEEIKSLSKIILDPKIYRNAKSIIPIIIKASSQLSLDAVKTKIKSFETDTTKIKIISEGVGNITEGDVIMASSDERVIIIGFEVKVEQKAQDQGDRFNIKPQTYDIIYKLAEDFEDIFNNRLPHQVVEKVIGKLKVLRIFSTNGNKVVLGGNVEEGIIKVNSLFKLQRRGFDIGNGKITNLQSMKIDAEEVREGNQCGMQVEIKQEIIPGDILIISSQEKVKI